MVPVLVRLTIIALLVYAGVSFWYGHVEQRRGGKDAESRQAAVVPSPAHEEQQADSAPPDYQIIVTRNIFNAALETSDAAVVRTQNGTETEDLAETSMQMVLLGTVTGSPNDARAIIRDEKTKQEDIHRVGSEVQGATIARIGRGKVVLQVNGREEILNIKDPESSGPRREAGVTREMPQVTADREGESRVPEAVPRRRISFRSNGPPPAAQEAGEQPAEEMQAEPAEPRLSADDEAPPPEKAEEPAADEQAR